MTRSRTRRWCCTALLALATTGGCLRNTSREPLGGTASQVLFGYVLKVSGKDTVRAFGARVWTAPETDRVIADQTGYWEISAGLVPGTYTVHAELEGIAGRAMGVRFPATRDGPNQPLDSRVVVVLGVERTEWPPPGELTRRLPRPTVGPARVRSIPPQ